MFFVTVCHSVNVIFQIPVQKKCMNSVHPSLSVLHIHVDEY